MVDVAVPKTCLTCETFVGERGGCCPECWSQLRFVVQPFCPVLGSPFSVDMGKGMLSVEAIADPPPFDRLRTVVLYDDLARRLVSSIKYADRLDVMPSVAAWMARAGKELLSDADLILPVPLHPSRFRSRRFNQSAELARHIAKRSEVSFRVDLLERTKATRQQVGLTETERARNVQAAFRVPAKKAIELQGRRVILIDDVYTTGATAKAATRALKRAGVTSVDILVFAKVETYIL